MLSVIQVNKDDWKRFSEDAHRAVFNERKSAEFDRIDYAWLVVNDRAEPVGYVTVRELDHETVYWQFGGGFEWAQKSILMAKSYDLMLAAQAKLSKRLATRIENTNIRMIKLALSRGLLIIGTRTWDGTVLLELAKEF